MGRSTKVERAFSKARDAEARRQKEIRIAQDEVDKINVARQIMDLQNKYNNPSSDPNRGNTRYRYERLVNVRNNTVRLLNSRANRWDVVPLSSMASIASRDLAVAQARVNQLKAQPSRAISMEQANKMVGSSRTTQRGAALSAAKSSGKSMSKVTGSGLVQKAYADSQPQAVKQRISSAAARDPANQFLTGSGNVQVSRAGKVIKPDSEEGGIIQDIFDRQAAQREINKEQKKLFDRVTGAADYKEAFNIQEQSRAINPNVGTFQQAFRGGELKETRGVKGLGDRTVTKTDFFGNPVADYKQTFLVDDTGKRVATINSQSRGAEFDFFKAPAKKTAVAGPPAQANTFDFFNLGAGSATQIKSDNDYLTDDEKAFAFFPDVPRGDDPLSQFGRGVTKGASNTLAGFWNLGTMAESGIRQASGGKPVPESEYVKFYSTPVTNVETGFFDAATGTGKSFFTGEKYDSKKRIETGFGEAYDNFFSKPVESAGSLVELVPYFGYGAAKTGVRAAGDFFGSLGKTATKGSKGPKKTGDFVQDFFYETPDKSTIFKLDTASTFSSRNVRTGSGVTQFFDTSAKSAGKTSGRTGPDDFFKATAKTKLTRTKGGGTFKEYRASDFAKNFMGGNTKTGQILIQKTKTKVKQKPVTKNKLVDQFFKPAQKQKTKAKTKQKAQVKQDFFGAFLPKVSPKQRQQSFLTPKLSQKQKTSQPTKQKQTTDFFAGTALKQSPKTPRPTKLRAAAGGFWWGFWGGGARGSRTKRNRRGDKSFTAWNVDDSKVGEFFGGPSYRTSKSTRVFRDADERVRRSSKKRRGKKKDFFADFF